VTSEDEVPMTTYVWVPTVVVMVDSVPSDGALLVALVTTSPAELVMYSIVPEVDVPLITVSVTEAEAPSSAMEEVFLQVSKNQCQFKRQLDGLSTEKKKLEIALTPSMHLVRLAIAVRVTGAEVTTGEAAQKDNKANMAMEEARIKCMFDLGLNFLEVGRKDLD
jgi:hypothetical protein